jgi:hypothetical protein
VSLPHADQLPIKTHAVSKRQTLFGTLGTALIHKPTKILTRLNQVGGDNAHPASISGLQDSTRVVAHIIVIDICSTNKNRSFTTSVKDSPLQGYDSDSVADSGCVNVTCPSNWQGDSDVGGTNPTDAGQTIGRLISVVQRFDWPGPERRILQRGDK